MKALSAILFGFTFSFVAQASSDALTIQELFQDVKTGQAIDISKMSGGYKGTCYVTLKKHIHGAVDEYNFTTDEALFVGNFTNANGEKVGLAISTEQTHGDLTIPEKLAFLLNADNAAFNFIKDFVKNGQTGVDNNFGKIAKGEDYSFNYVATIADKSLTVKTERLSDCRGGTFCNPPILQGCSYGYSQGLLVYEGCLRPNDETSFKQVSSTTIISHRTADQLGEPSNNMSFTLPEISSYCVFQKR